METKNKYLKTKNVILNKLNTTHYVTVPFDKDANKNEFIVYSLPEGSGMNFEFCVTASKSATKSVVFNGNRYTDTESLWEAVKEWHGTLMFDPSCYDPHCRKAYAVERKLDWYLRKCLGLSNGRDTSLYVLKNIYGEPIVHISFEVKHKDVETDEGDGFIFRSIDAGSWVSEKFTSAEDAVSKINSIISTECVTTVMYGMDVLKKLRGGFDSLDDAKYSSWQRWLTGNEVSYKENIIHVLENLLNTLKNGKNENNI